MVCGVKPQSESAISQKCQNSCFGRFVRKHFLGEFQRVVIDSPPVDVSGNIFLCKFHCFIINSNSDDDDDIVHYFACYIQPLHVSLAAWCTYLPDLSLRNQAVLSYVPTLTFQKQKTADKRKEKEKAIKPGLSTKQPSPT